MLYAKFSQPRCRNGIRFLMQRRLSFSQIGGGALAEMPRLDIAACYFIHVTSAAFRFKAHVIYRSPTSPPLGPFTNGTASSVPLNVAPCRSCRPSQTPAATEAPTTHAFKPWPWPTLTSTRGTPSPLVVWLCGLPTLMYSEECGKKLREFPMSSEAPGLYLQGS